MILEKIRENYDIPFNCNFYKGLRISYKKENKYFYRKRVEIFIYKYDNEDKYKIIAIGLGNDVFQRDFIKSSEEARKEITLVISTGYTNEKVKEKIKEFLDSFYKDDKESNKKEILEDMAVEYSSGVVFCKDIRNLSEFENMMKRKLGRKIRLHDIFKIKEKDTEVTFLPVDEAGYNYSFTHYDDSIFYLIIKKNGEYLFRPFCYFTRYENRMGTRTNPYIVTNEKSDIGSLEDLKELLRDSLEDTNILINACVIAVDSFFDGSTYRLYKDEEFLKKLKDYKEMITWYGDNDFKAEDELDLIFLTHSKGDDEDDE